VEEGTLVSEVVSQYVQLESTFADGAMRLLRSDYAQTSIALLRELFADGTTHRDSEVFYVQVDAMLDELDIADCKIWRHGDGSKLDAREVVNEKWVREFKLLERRILPTGESEHSLRPEALAVLAATDDISNETIKLSSPRVEMIVEALKKLSMVVNPDPVAQRKDLVEKVKEAQKALERERRRKEEAQRKAEKEHVTSMKITWIKDKVGSMLGRAFDDTLGQFYDNMTDNVD
jgi:hypothetical protein